jgi:DNA-directed RNA polymerase subunit RPC12/RpoP
VRIVTVIGALAAGILWFFAVIFALASSYDANRLIVSAVLFVIGLAILAVIYYTGKKPTTVINQLEVPGQMKANVIRCPNCSANVDVKSIKVINGVPYVSCPYCGKTSAITEEPKW